MWSPRLQSGGTRLQSTEWVGRVDRSDGRGDARIWLGPGLAVAGLRLTAQMVTPASPVGFVGLVTRIPGFKCSKSGHHANKEARSQQGAASGLGTGRWQVTPVTSADFAAWVTTPGMELPVTCGHGVCKVAAWLQSAGGLVVAGLRLRAQMITPASAGRCIKTGLVTGRGAAWVSRRRLRLRRSGRQGPA
jgi:hypothetical protein